MDKRLSDWTDIMEKISPDELIEIPNPKTFWKNREIFADCGFSIDVFRKLVKVVEQQLWSILALWCIARSTPKNAKILEIGSGRGGSLLTIGLANSTALLTNIDRFENYTEATHEGAGKNGFSYGVFRANVREINGRVNTIKKWSDEAVVDIENNFYDMIFIDGNHGFDFVQRDIINYAPKLKDGGILCGHDYHPRFPGVISAVKHTLEGKYIVCEQSSVWLRTEKWMTLDGIS